MHEKHHGTYTLGDRMKNLCVSVLPGRMAICLLPSDEPIPERPAHAQFWSATLTDDELSIVMPEESAKAHWKKETGWRCLKVLGPLNSALTGILASLAAPLAQAGVSILALSTYNTDYILVKEQDLEKTQSILKASGHVLK